MNKKLVFGISILFGLGVYFSYPTIDRALKNYRMEQELKEYGHTSPKEIIQGLSATDDLKSKIESGVNYINKAIKNKDLSKLEYLFFADCDNISHSDKIIYIDNFLNQHPRLELEYSQQGEKEIIAGVSILNSRGELIRADELYGTSARDLHFRCSYEL